MTKAQIRAGLGILAAYVGLYACIGLFAGPAGDDYFGYNVYSHEGFWGTNVSAWLTVGGRFTGTFIVAVGYAVDIMHNYYILVPLSLAVSLSSLYFMLTSFFDRLSASAKLFAALLLQSVWLTLAIELKQSLFWLAGLNYYWTSSFFLIELALVANIYKGRKAGLYLPLLAVMVLLNSGMSELSAAYQIPMFAGAVLAAAFSGGKKFSLYMFAMLLISFFGLYLQMICPGNSHRIAEFLPLFGSSLDPTTRNVYMAYKIGVQGGLISAFHFFTRPVIIYALLLFIPVIADSVKRPRFAEGVPFRVWHIVLFEILTVCCFQAVGGYSTGSALVTRAVSVVRWVMAAQWILFFAFLYRNDRLTERIRNMRLYRYKEIILLLCLFLNYNFARVGLDLGTVREYSRQITERNEYIERQKALGNFDVIVDGITAAPKSFFADSMPPGGHPSGGGYARFFEVNSIAAKDTLVQIAESLNESDELPVEVSGEELEKIRAGDEETRIRLIIKLSDSGVDHPYTSYAQFLLARCLDTSDRLSSPYVQKNDEMALEYYFKLAENGSQDARNLLWTFYMGGVRTNRDWDIIRWGLMAMLSPF